MELNLKNHWALVCGASKGIGAATAKQLSDQGAKVILLARDESQLQKVQQELSGESLVWAVDLNDRAALKQKIEDFIGEKGPITIIVNNSGGPKAGPLMEADEVNFLDGFAQHVLAATALVQLATPGMKEQKYGRIINVISTSVKIPIPNLGVSNTIRGAMASWSKTLANELGPFGITVNNVLPGFTATERLDTLIAGAAKRLNKSSDEVSEMWKNQVPAKRFAQPEETAQAIGFLAAPAASYINGINLPVDGGRLGTL